MMTMTMEPKEGMMIIMKRNELWQNGFYVTGDGDDGSAADYDNKDLTKLRLRRQRERQKNNRFN